MHDILSRSYALQPTLGPLRPWKRWALNRYQVAEERAWQKFDALVAINRDEQRLAARVVGETTVFHAPMGADLSSWPYSPAPSTGGIVRNLCEHAASLSRAAIMVQREVRAPGRRIGEHCAGTRRADSGA